MNRFLDVAKKAASQAGEFLLANLDVIPELNYKGEGHFDPVSHIDKGAEDIILSIISDTFPDHGLISEERERKYVDSDYTWVIDPLDGTINFIHGQKYFGVSIALLHREDIIVGVIYNPILNEMFTAVKGEGAYLNEGRIQVSEAAILDQSLLSTGFPYDRSSEAFSRSIKNFACLLRASQAVRRYGSAALDLSNVACGRFDGYLVTGSQIWDYMAGALIVTEAGGKVTDLEGNPFQVYHPKNEILATNGKIHELILKALLEEAA